MHFLCDAIDLKQSVEGNLKVSWKFLATVLDIVRFIVNLYNFPVPLVPQENPSFPMVCHLPLPSRTTSKTLPPPWCPLPFFLLTLIFWGHLNSQIRTNKMVNSLDYHPCPPRLATRIHPFIFLKLPTTLSLSFSLENACWIFSQTFILHLVWEKFQIYGVHISGKCIDSRHFYSSPSQLKTFPQVLVVTS